MPVAAPRMSLYARQSKAGRSGQTTSVDDQLDVLRKRAADLGAEVVAERSDRAIGASAATMKVRPGWAALEDDIRSGAVDLVGLFEVSRSSRRLGEWAAFRDLCAARGVRWVLPDRVVDPASTSDRLSSGIGAVVAEGEAGAISDRLRRTMSANAAKGKPHGRDRYGYVRKYDPRTGALVGTEVEPDEAAIVRRIVTEALAGRPLRAIGRDLDADGIPCPSDSVAARRGRTPRGHHWTGRVLRDLLLHRAYLGLRVHVSRSRFDADTIVANDEYGAEWDALISESEHAELVAILTAPGRTTRPAGMAEVAHWLSGTLRCGKDTCNSVLRWDGRGGKVAYRCVAPGCFGVFVNAEGIENLIGELVVSRLSTPEAAPALAPEVADPAEDLRTAIRAVEDRLAEVDDEAESGTISVAMAGRLEARLTARLADLQADLQAVQTPGLPAWASGLGEAAADAWGAWTAPQRHRVARAMFTRIVIRPQGRTGRPAKGARPVSPARVGVQWTGASEVVWGEA